MEFLGDRGSAHDTAPFEHGDPETRRGKISGADETVVAAADDHHVIPKRLRHGVRLYSVNPAATFENPQSTYVTSPVIALDSDEK
jgi:hypothetical protein